jgi:hypothetical protein
MDNLRGDNNWAWVTHALALLFSVICLGIVTYSIVAIQDMDMAKATMGFSSGLLGVILGFYFNREQLVKEIKQKEYFSSQALDLEAAVREMEVYRRALDRFDKVIEEVREIEREIEEE